MEDALIFLDTSILIDHFRKTNKENSKWYQLAQQYRLFGVSAITQYEVFTGSNARQDVTWKSLFEDLIVFPFDTEACIVAVDIEKSLKKKRKSIDIPDLIIAATAIRNNCVFATLNTKHFESIDDLNLLGF